MEYEQNIIDYWKSLRKTAINSGRHDMSFVNLFLNKGYKETKKTHEYCAGEKQLKLILNQVKRYIGNIKVKCLKCKKGMIPNPDMIGIHDSYFGNMRTNFLSTSTDGMHTLDNRPDNLFKCLFCGGIKYTFK